jgi:nifR3 family TIM-barrel protein
MPDTFKPLRIGPVAVDFPVVLAPLAGYSDVSYRLICRELSAPFCSSEAMLDKHVLHPGDFGQRLMRLADGDHPIAGQLLGAEPKTMAAAAVRLRDAGFDAIDLNFACPVRKVLTRGRGGALMGRPGQALDIVEAVLEAVPDKPVTVKLRRSFKDADRDSADFWRIAGEAFELGAAAICVHARSVEQKYQGRADWEFLKRVKLAFPERTIVGSGDVLAAGDAWRMIRETGVDGASAARGAIGNPWFFRQARDLAAGRPPFSPSLAEQRELIGRHFWLTREIYGSRRYIKVMRNFAIHYARLHPRPSEARNGAAGVVSEKDWWEFLDSYYPAAGEPASSRADETGPRV